MKPLPPNVSPNHVMAAAERLFRADATKQVQDEARRRKIHPDDRPFWIEQYIAVRVYEMWLALAVGGGDDYCI
jgi:hypothetical protein